MTVGPVFATESAWDGSHIRAHFPDRSQQNGTREITEPAALLKESLCIVRGETMKLATKQHLEAMSQNRDELLLSLHRAVAITKALLTEIETVAGPADGMRKLLAEYERRIAVEEAA